MLVVGFIVSIRVWRIRVSGRVFCGRVLVSFSVW